MRVIRFLLKIPAVLLLAVVSLIVVTAKLIEKISSVLLGLLILIIISAVIWCFWQGRVQDALLYLGVGVAVVLLLFAIEALMMLMEGVQRRIGGFIRS